MKALLLTRRDRLAKRLARHLAKLELLRRNRLGSGLFFVVICGLLTFKIVNVVTAGLLLVSLSVFIVLVNATRRLQTTIAQYQWKIAYLDRQIQRMAGIASKHNVTMEEDPTIKDLEIFGPHSLFNLLDETLTDRGLKKLKGWLSYSPIAASIRSHRQSQIQNLSKHFRLLEKFQASNASNVEKLRADEFLELMGVSGLEPRFYQFWKMHQILFPLMVIYTALIATGVIDFSMKALWVPYIIFNISSLSLTQRAFRHSVSLELTLSSLRPLFQFIEKHPRIFSEMCAQTLAHKPSLQMKRLSRYLSALSVEAHPLVYLVINAFMPWSFFFSSKAEKWREENLSSFEKMIEELSDLEAYISATLFYSYQTQTFAQFASTPQFKAENIYHPLILRDQVVANNVNWGEGLKIALITGSNMSGKSTFLKTVGLNQVLAMAGLPVFAKSLVTWAAHVETCLGIRDSIEEGYSSFYYEVKRVKAILDRVRKGEPTFFMIDEIFRGTNNRERLLGSQSLIKEFLKHSNILGIITTHDLELGKLETKPALENYHFRDDVTTDLLHFSYKMASGVCPTTNALKIMAQEGLPVT